MTNQEVADELQYAIELIKQDGKDWLDERDILILEAAISALQEQDVPDINVGNCPYCHEDSDGFVFPIEKNGHAYVWHDVDGWVISLKAKGCTGAQKSCTARCAEGS